MVLRDVRFPCYVILIDLIDLRTAYADVGTPCVLRQPAATRPRAIDAPAPAPRPPATCTVRQPRRRSYSAQLTLLTRTVYSTPY